MTYEEMRIRAEELAASEPVVRRGEDGLPLPEDSEKFIAWLDEVKEFINNNDVPPDLLDIIAPVY